MTSLEGMWSTGSGAVTTGMVSLRLSVSLSGKEEGEGAGVVEVGIEGDKLRRGCGGTLSGEVGEPWAVWEEEKRQERRGKEGAQEGGKGRRAGERGFGRSRSRSFFFSFES